MWDWAEIKDNGAKLENMVAVHLLKFCHYLTDVEGYRAGLNFLKNKQKQEVDFLVTIDNAPLVLRGSKDIPGTEHLGLKIFRRRPKDPLYVPGRG